MPAEMINSAVRLISSWYYGSLPRKFGSSLIDYSFNGHELAKIIAPKSKMQLTAKHLAAFSMESVIFLPVAYFSEEYYEKALFLPDLKSKGVPVALSLINGSQIHEALHIRHDYPCLFDKLIASLKPSETKTKALSYLKQPFFLAVANIVLDIANEAWCQKEYNGLFTFLEAKNRVLFNEEAWKDSLTKFAKDGQIALLFSFLKWEGWSKPMRALEGLAKYVDAFEECRFSTWAGDHEREVELMVRIFEMLKSDGQDSRGEGDDESEGEEGEGEGAKGAKGKGKPGQGGSASGESGDGEPGDMKVDTSAETTLDEERDAEVIEALEKLYYEIKDDIDKAIEKRSLKGIDRLTENIHVQFRNISDTAMKTDRVTEVKAYESLGTYFRRAREERHTPGQPRVRGTRVIKREIYRIATDQKMMSYPDATAVKVGKPEIVVLIDASGSMRGIYDDVVDHAYSLFKELVEAGVPVSVYAHTSTSDVSYSELPLQPIVFGVASFNLPLGDRHVVTSTGNNQMRFGKAKSIRLAENFDGYALLFAGKQFTARPGTKMLLVLSDGQPAGGSIYSGSMAFNHTKDVVDGLRREGVTVLAVSLVTHVMEANNRIYGKENNLPAYDKARLTKALVGVMQRVALERK